jgi:hypothetical protein
MSMGPDLRRASTSLATQPAAFCSVRDKPSNIAYQQAADLTGPRLSPIAELGLTGVWQQTQRRVYEGREASTRLVL